MFTGITKSRTWLAYLRTKKSKGRVWELHKKVRKIKMACLHLYFTFNIKTGNKFKTEAILGTS